MTLETLHNTIRARFETQIAAANNLPTQYDNDPTEPNKTAIWCRLTINLGGNFQNSIGSPHSNRLTRVGVMTAQLFNAVGKGDKDLLAMADKIEAAFKNVAASNAHFGVPKTIKVGRTETYWQLNVNCPFYADTLG